MKKISITLYFVLLTLIGFGQVNFYKIGIGAGLGTNISYADVRENSQSYGGYGQLIYNLSPFLTVDLEAQIGKLKGGNIITNPHNRQFTNSYKTLSINGKIALGQFVDVSQNKFLSVMRGAYMGIGVGAISNKMSYIVRYKPNTQAQYPPLGYQFPGKDKSTNLLMPVNLGMNFYFKDSNDQLRYIFNVNYQGNITFGEGLDGYDDSMAIFNNKAPDIYTFFSVGVKYNFGPVGLSKRIF